MNQTDKKFAVCLYDTPVLNTKNFSEVYGGIDGSTLKFSNNKLVKELEFTAYPGTVCGVLEEYTDNNNIIYKVRIKEYDIVLGGTELYVDSRFVKVTNERPDDRKIVKPTMYTIYSYFEKAENARYVWGGNNISGVSKMREFYPPPDGSDEFTYDHWMMRGLDCSGLIYEATGGYTPRNTHQLIHYGKPVKIQNKTSDEIINLLRPLDMIVWKGHVIFVYDDKTTIESAHSAGGVSIKETNKTLEEIIKSRIPADEWKETEKKIFVVRRWFEE